MRCVDQASNRLDAFVQRRIDDRGRAQAHVTAERVDGARRQPTLSLNDLPQRRVMRPKIAREGAPRVAWVPGASSFEFADERGSKIQADSMVRTLPRAVKPSGVKTGANPAEWAGIKRAPNWRGALRYPSGARLCRKRESLDARHAAALVPDADARARPITPPAIRGGTRHASSTPMR